MCEVIYLKKIKFVLTVDQSLNLFNLIRRDVEEVDGYLLLASPSDDDYFSYLKQSLELNDLYETIRSFLLKKKLIE